MFPKYLGRVVRSWHREVDSKETWAPHNDHDKWKTMVQLLTFRFFPLAYVSRRELIYPYLNTKWSPLEPPRTKNQDVESGGSRRESVMTKFAINTHVMRISYVFGQTYAVKRQIVSYTIFVLVLVPFRVSQSQTTFIQWSVLVSLLHLWNTTEKKDVVAQAVLCILVPKTLLTCKRKRI